MFRIESGGKVSNTKVLYNGEQIGYVEKLELKIDSAEEKTKLVLTLISPQSDIKIEDSDVQVIEKIIKNKEIKKKKTTETYELE